MQGDASYMITPILSVFLPSLALHSTSTIFSAANNHSLLLPNWLGCLHSFLYILRCPTLFQSLYWYFCCFPRHRDPLQKRLYIRLQLRTALYPTSILKPCWHDKSDITIRFFLQQRLQYLTINDRHVFTSEPNEHLRPCGPVQLLPS